MELSGSAVSEKGEAAIGVREGFLGGMLPGQDRSGLQPAQLLQCPQYTGRPSRGRTALTANRTSHTLEREKV